MLFHFFSASVITDAFFLDGRFSLNVYLTLPMTISRPFVSGGFLKTFAFVPDHHRHPVMSLPRRVFNSDCERDDFFQREWDKLLNRRHLENRFDVDIDHRPFMFRLLCQTTMEQYTALHDELTRSKEENAELKAENEELKKKVKVISCAKAKAQKMAQVLQSSSSTTSRCTNKDQSAQAPQPLVTSTQRSSGKRSLAEFETEETSPRKKLAAFFEVGT